MVNGKTIQMSEHAASPAARERVGSPAPAADYFMAIVAHYQGPLLRYVGRILGDINDQREDVVQETFVRLHRQVSAHGWSSIKHPTTWLFRVAHNLTLDELRRKVRRQGTAQVAAESSEAAPEQAAQEIDAVGEAIRQEARQVVLREMARLDDSYRQVLLLKIVQGMTLREVAEVVGVSLSTVNYRLNEGLGLLARKLRRTGIV
jgi:RNA polymerase sigma-70 factor (ECF subfamily)